MLMETRHYIFDTLFGPGNRDYSHLRSYAFCKRKKPLSRFLYQKSKPSVAA